MLIEIMKAQPVDASEDYFDGFLVGLTIGDRIFQFWYGKRAKRRPWR